MRSGWQGQDDLHHARSVYCLKKMSPSRLVDRLDESNRVIQGLWIGSELSVMERLSVVSFLRQGHEYHLYTYNELPDVPDGVVVKDANAILPASAIFQYKERPSYAGFANQFRYQLLLERGGWWADADVICLRPFDFAEDYVFASEEFAGQAIRVNNNVIKSPVGSEVMAYATQVCRAKKPDQLVWGETGPKLLSKLVKKYCLDKYQKPYYIFCPISDWHKLLEPYVAGVNEDAYAIHLWNEMWRLEKCDKNATYHPACIYEQLKSKYLGTQSSSLDVRES
jgi:Glycosyltransferase sugar-binding region containing DXD motif